MIATGETLGLAEWIIDDTCIICVYRLDSNYFRSINTGEVELRLFRSNLSKDSIGVEKSFRRGKLVDITQGD